MATRVRLNEFNHDELACDVARDFRVAYRDVKALYGPAAMRRIPLFGVGHSLGAKVHVLLNCYPEVVDVAKRRKVCGFRDVAHSTVLRSALLRERFLLLRPWGVRAVLFGEWSAFRQRFFFVPRFGSSGWVPVARPPACRGVLPLCTSLPLKYPTFLLVARKACRVFKHQLPTGNLVLEELRGISLALASPGNVRTC